MTLPLPGTPRRRTVRAPVRPIAHSDGRLSAGSTLGFLAFALLLALAPCPARPAAAQDLAGRVVDPLGGAPVSAAVVTVVGTPHHVFTDSLGGFAFADVGTGPHELLVQHPGYHTLRRTVTVPAGGVRDLLLAPTLRAIPLDPILARTITPLERRRRAAALAHHVFVSREELEQYERRGALHVGDALRYHAPTTVRLREYPMSICVKPTRAAGQRVHMESERPDCPDCVAVFLNGMLLDCAIAPDLLYDLPLDAVEEMEFMPPVDAMTRVGHAGENGALFITMRKGSELAAGVPRRPGPRTALGVVAGRYDPDGGADPWYPTFGVRAVHGLTRIAAVKAELSRVRFERWVLCGSEEACDVRKATRRVLYLAVGARLQPVGGSFQPYMGVTLGGARRETGTWEPARSLDIGLRVALTDRFAFELEHRWRADRTDWGTEGATELDLVGLVLF